MKGEYNFLNLFGQEPASVSLAPGGMLFSKGDPADAMFVVKTGEVEIFDGDTVYETIAAGGILGEMALVDGAPRSAGVRATTASEIIRVDERRFLKMVEQTPFFAIRVMRVMTQRLRKANDRLSSDS